MKVFFHSENYQFQDLASFHLSTDEMMLPWLKGLIQNRNESLYTQIWMVCRKHRNATKHIIDFATVTAILNYNFGYLGGKIFPILGIAMNHHMLTLREKIRPWTFLTKGRWRINGSKETSTCLGNSKNGHLHLYS